MVPLADLFRRCRGNVMSPLPGAGPNIDFDKSLKMIWNGIKATGLSGSAAAPFGVEITAMLLPENFDFFFFFFYKNYA